ncbi:hypothetical protein ACTRXD_09200 [Nitrospira sp. T9]|uniref:hypothetical protein n=1 Tax=Nitrospira sp. T9 TaxID=3456077 RepID=UPI003F9B55A4
MSDEEQAPMEVSPNKTKDPLPSIEKTAFSCPHCGAYTHQFWYSLFGKKKIIKIQLQTSEEQPIGIG